MANKYQTRANYERLYGWLLKSSGYSDNQSLMPAGLPDKELLKAINYMLIFSGCIPLTKNELSQQLH